MTTNKVVKQLYKELQECRKENGKLKERVRELEQNLEEKNEKIENLLLTVELILGNEI